ncbi:MAG: carbon-nitrogen hydrolase family protein [Chryseolinea sp.]
MKIALASPPFPTSIDNALQHIEKSIVEAAKGKAQIICFPESYLPGYPGVKQNMEERSAEKLNAALARIREMAAKNSIAVIIPMDWHHQGQVFNVAHVISGTGEMLGYQSKNQLDPTEDTIWSAGTQRSIFEIDGVKFGITICHEGFRYPESVRWAAMRDAKIVFQPHFTGSDVQGAQLVEWGSKNNPYYEKAMMMRAMENTIYFASVGYAMRYQESATCLIAPDGICTAQQAYGKAGVLIADIDPALATGILAKRFKQDLVMYGTKNI